MKNIIIIFSVLLFGACGSADKAEPKAELKTRSAETTVRLTDIQLKNAGVVTGSIEQKNISAILKVSGKIDVPPQNIVSVSVPLGGYLRSTSLLTGMHVVKGQTLATMEDPQYIQLQQDYLTAKTKLIYAEQEYNRQKELNESKAGSDKVLQLSQAEFGSQQILVRSLAEKLRLININPDKLNAASISRYISVPSPITGFVSKVNVNIGKYSNPADILFEIVNPADIHLGLDVFEKDVNKLYIGQKLFAYSNANADRKYPCKIILISKDFTGDRTVEVHCHFDKYDKELLPGMFMNAEIQVDDKAAQVLPSEAITSYENKNFVFIEKGANQFEITEIKIGNSDNGFTEIDNDSLVKLKDKKIVVRGAYSLLMKMKNTSEE